jgi:hypothetical protein
MAWLANELRWPLRRDPVKDVALRTEARHHLVQPQASIATPGHEMTEAQLRELLSQEMLAWAERSPADIVAELAKPQTYRRGTGDTWHEIELTLLEATDDYIHVGTSINDGSLVWALKPITSSFLIYRDGRIEI